MKVRDIPEDAIFGPTPAIEADWMAMTRTPFAFQDPEGITLGRLITNGTSGECVGYHIPHDELQHAIDLLQEMADRPIPEWEDDE